MAKLVVHLSSGVVAHQLKGPSITVGRIAGNDIQIADPSVSAHHAKFVLKNGRYHLRDLDSTNSTWLDDEAVSLAVLHGDSKLRFGTIPADFSEDIAPPADDGSQAKLTAAEKEIAALAKERDELRAQIEANAKGQQQSAHALQGELGEVQSQLEFVSKERDAVLQRNRELAGKIGAEETKAAALKEEREQAAQRVKDLEEQQTAFKTSAEEQHATTQARLAELTAMVTGSEKKGTAAERERDALASQLEAARKALDALQVEVKNLRAETATSAALAAELTETKARLTTVAHGQKSLDERRAQLEAENAKAAQERDAAKAEAAEISAQLADSKGAVAKLNEDLQNLRQESAAAGALSEELSDVKSRLEGAAAEQKTVQEKLAAAESRIAELSTSRTAAEESASELREARAATETLSAEHRAALEKLSTAEAQIAALTAEQAAHGKLSEDFASARQSLGLLQEEKRGFERSVAKAHEERDQVSRELAQQLDAVREELTAERNAGHAKQTELSAEIAKISDALAAARTERDELSRQLENARQELAAGATERDAAKTRQDELVAKSENLTQALAAAHAERDQMRTELTSQLEEERQKGSAFASERDAAHKRRDDLLVELEARTQELATARGDRESAQADFSRQLDAAGKSLAVITAERDAVQARQSELSAEIEDLRGQVATQRGEIERSAREQQETQRELDSTRAALQASTAQHEEATRARDEQTAAVSALRKTNEMIAAERDASTESADHAREHAKEVQSRMEQLAEEHERLKVEFGRGREAVEGHARELSILKGQRDAADTSREQMMTRLSALERDFEQLRKERDALKGQHFALATERDVLKAEVGSLIEQRNLARELQTKLSDAEQQLEMFAAQQRAVSAELEQAKLAEQELNSALAESPKLANWLHSGKTNAQKQKPVEANKIVSIDDGIGAIKESIRKMRRALLEAQQSPADGLRELGMQIGAINVRAETLPGRRALHRLGSTLGLLVGEMRSAPTSVRPASFQTVHQVIDVLERLLHERNPPSPYASAVAVDRDERALGTIITAMKSIEFKLFSAEDSRPALETLAAEDHDLVLLDWQTAAAMGSGDAIRSMPRHQLTPIIFLATAETEAASRASGDEVLLKPLTVPEVAVKSLVTVLQNQLTASRHEPVFTAH